MSDYVPPGYIAITDACIEAMKVWHAADLAALDQRFDVERKRVGAAPHTDPFRAALQMRAREADLEEQARDALAPIWEASKTRFRDFLFCGDLVGCYFSPLHPTEPALNIPENEWALPSTNSVIQNGEYQLYGLQGLVVRVLIEKKKLNGVLNGSEQLREPQVSTVPGESKRRGRRPTKRDRVVSEMRNLDPAELNAMSGKQMEYRFKAGRTLCEDARKIVLSETARP